MFSGSHWVGPVEDPVQAARSCRRAGATSAWLGWSALDTCLLRSQLARDSIEQNGSFQAASMSAIG